ncbi:hypothetical protein [Campylobacter sp. MIT 97-5078]|uniref:hypothetical protein n=1 Tax=Campylobacter sp. MIT 97-5078 TaxID=1548153 RepID=UPI000512BD71|nr:hypothetical protein [Campylobacter sp. MIT 97-5078]KGI56455.1 hypothetical protein LR59_07015 [Campylobacter sp. MIT 97-5078]TQR28024.1 hypothetical protein DMB91_01985 [Campylobacter sp. MIT 97-5078]
MFLRFDFTYISDNDFLEFLLRYYARDFAFALRKTQDHIILDVKSDEAGLTSFCDHLNFIANSVFLRHFEVKALEDEHFIQEEPKNLADFTKRDFLSSKNLNAYIEKNELETNEWSCFVDDMLSFDEKEFQNINKENFNVLLDRSVKELKNAKFLVLKNAFGVYKIKLFDNDFKASFLMPTDLKALNSAFVCSNENLKLLASLEKPVMKLRFSSIFRKNHSTPKHEFKVKMAYNLFLFALGLRLFEEGFKFLSFFKLEHFQDELELFEFENQLVIVRGLDFVNQRAKELILSKEDKNYARISYILSEFKQESLLLDLSKTQDDIVLLDKELKLLELTMPSSAKQIYQDICADAIGKRLYDNFALQFELLQGEFKLEKSFFSLLGLVGLVLKLDDSPQKAALKLLELSDESKIPRGVKIDYRFKENSKEFDYTRTLRSVMSFLLAGVEATNIAYGAVESLAFFLRDFYDELREKNQAQIAILSGSLFEHKSLLKNALKHLKNCKIAHAPLYI